MILFPCAEYAWKQKKNSQKLLDEFSNSYPIWFLVASQCSNYVDFRTLESRKLMKKLFWLDGVKVKSNKKIEHFMIILFQK